MKIIREISIYPFVSEDVKMNLRDEEEQKSIFIDSNGIITVPNGAFTIDEVKQLILALQKATELA